jgi:hypothetical protein
MYTARLVLLATAIGLLAPVASAQTIATMDGHYYKLVPLRGPLPRNASQVVTVIPETATASVPDSLSVPQSSNCRLTTFENGEFQPQYVTLCGQP